jgi:uncharacterized membrane protein
MTMPAEPADRESRDDLPPVHRLLALSDGVVAIALTLLVLQLKVPALKLADQNSAGDLATQLGKDTDQIISFLIAFYVIAQFWIAHYQVFREIAGQREGLAWWNFAFLFTISIMPFTSDLLGQYASNPLAVTIFAVNLLAASLATQATLHFGGRTGLRKETVSPAAARAERLRVAANLAVIVLSIAVAWVNTSAAKYCWLLLAVAPYAADRWTGRHRAAGTTPAS